MKKIVLSLTILALFTVLLAACTNSSSVSGPNVVHMDDIRFLQESVKIKKGETITLANDVITIHVISNGTWDANGTPKPSTEPGAPSVQSLQVNGNDTQKIGPFTTSGTYHLYCTVHPGMNLTVIVQ